MQHDAHLILHKTEKALQELRQRTYGLNPRVRQILILIDGRRTIRELARMMPGEELARCVEVLLAQGFVQRVPAAGGTGPAPARPGIPGVPGAAPAPGTPGTAPGAAAAQSPPAQAAQLATAPPSAEFRAVQRKVVRLLLDAIGPHGDELAIRFERSRSLDELRALVPAAASVVEAVSGRAASLRFLERVDGIRNTP